MKAHILHTLLGLICFNLAGLGPAIEPLLLLTHQLTADYSFDLF